MAVFFNCVPFGTDITILLGCLFRYKDLIVAKIMAASHEVTISGGTMDILPNGLPVLFSACIYGDFRASRS